MAIEFVNQLGVGFSEVGRSMNYYGLWLFVIIALIFLISAFLYHFIVRPRMYKIMVNIKFILEEIEHYTDENGQEKERVRQHSMDGGYDKGKIVDNGTRMILLHDGIATYFKKPKYICADDRLYEPTTRGKLQLTMYFKGKSKNNYAYVKPEPYYLKKSFPNSPDGHSTKPLLWETVEQDTLTVILEDMNHQADKRRTSTPLKDITVIISLVIIIVCLFGITFYIGSKWNKIAEVQALMQKSCESNQKASEHMEKVCTSYIQLSNELCDKRVQIQDQINALNITYT